MGSNLLRFRGLSKTPSPSKVCQMKIQSSKRLSFLFTTDSIDRILRRPEKLDYKGLVMIIDYTGKSSSAAMQELHKSANILYQQRGYDKYTAVDKKAEIRPF